MDACSWTKHFAAVASQVSQSSVDTGVSYMYAIVIDNDLLQKIDKSEIFDTAEIRDNTVTLS